MTMSQQARQSGVRRVLCVDDDAYLTDLMQYALSREGYTVQIADNAAMALLAVAAQRPDLVVLDINLPDMSGFELCSRLREQYNLPVIFLSGRSTESEIVTGFTQGADDYITKPFSMHVLTYRIEAVLRRVQAAPAELRQRRLTRVLDGWFDADQGLLTRNGSTVKLTATESRIFALLLAHEGQVLSADRILDQIWDIDSETSVSVIKTHIRYLRAKLGPVFGSHEVICTVRGLGYTFRQQAHPAPSAEEAAG